MGATTLIPEKFHCMGWSIQSGLQPTFPKVTWVQAYGVVGAPSYYSTTTNSSLHRGVREATLLSLSMQWNTPTVI